MDHTHSMIALRLRSMGGLWRRVPYVRGDTGGVVMVVRFLQMFAAFATTLSTAITTALQDSPRTAIWRRETSSSPSIRHTGHPPSGRGVFDSVADLVETIEDYLRCHNRDPKPFRWTASAEAIIEKINRCRNIYETLH